MSLLLISSLTLTSCNDESEELSQANGKQLQINVGVTQPESRAVITGTAMPDESIIGVTVVDNTGTAYQGQDYNNVSFTASKDEITQTWTPSKEVLLSGEPATLYAYYPYQSIQEFDLEAIPMDMTEEDQKDWMYATSISGLSDANHTATIKLNHALTNFKLTFYKENYSGRGEVTAFSLQSDGLATTGILNAKTGAVTPTNDAALIRTVTYTLTDQENATHFDAMVIPTAEEGDVTVSVTVDGHTYSSTTTVLTLAQSTAYNLTLKLTSTGLSVTSVSLTDWEEAELPEADFEPTQVKPNVSKVYAVRKSDEALVLPENIDTENEEYIAVALHVTGENFEQKFWIEMNGTTNAAYGDGTEWVWGSKEIDTPLDNFNDTDIPSSLPVNGLYPQWIEDYDKIDGDFTKWVGVLSDFNGINNTEIIIKSHNENDIEITNHHMCGVLLSFNADDEQNQGYNDWYIPAAGQLGLMGLYNDVINVILNMIGGEPLKDSYWSSSELDGLDAWYVGLYYYEDDNFYTSNIGWGPKTNNDMAHGVRFIRDF